MYTKLTLRLDEETVGKAKKLAADRGKSVSGMVADLISALDAAESGVGSLPPVTRALHGSLKDAQVDEEDYKAYLTDKYL